MRAWRHNVLGVLVPLTLLISWFLNFNRIETITCVVGAAVIVMAGQLEMRLKRCKSDRLRWLTNLMRCVIGKRLTKYCAFDRSAIPCLECFQPACASSVLVRGRWLDGTLMPPPTQFYSGARNGPRSNRHLDALPQMRRSNATPNG